MDVAEGPAGFVCANGNEAKIKGASVFTYLRKGRARREV